MSQFSETSSTRYARGYESINSIFGSSGTLFIKRMQAISPDFARHIVEFAYGDIMTRPALDIPSRELAIVAALTAMGRSPAELEIHIEGALNVGCSPEALLEVIMQMAVYAGFPNAIHGLEALHSALNVKGLSLAALAPPASLHSSHSPTAAYPPASPEGGVGINAGAE